MTAIANTERPIAPSRFQPRIAPGDGPGWDKAEYATPDSSKLDSGFYTEDRGLPWHVTLSRRLDLPELMTGSKRKLTIGEALVLAEVDWEVDTAPVFATIDGQSVPVGNLQVTYRKDNGMVLSDRGPVSDQYRIVQNAEAFAFGDNILDEGGANCESAGSLYEGRMVFVSFELPDSIHVEGDPSDYRLFLLISNGHDGRNAFRASVTTERVICRNTLRMAHKHAVTSWTLRHTAGLEGRLAQAKQALGIAHRYAEEFTASASDLVNLSLPERQVRRILEKVYPLTEAQEERIAQKPEAREKVPAGLVERVYQESPTVEPVKGTGWGLLQAVAEYEDHAKKYHDTPVARGQDRRAQRLVFDDGPDAKQRTFDILQKVK